MCLEFGEENTSGDKSASLPLPRSPRRRRRPCARADCPSAPLTRLITTPWQSSRADNLAAPRHQRGTIFCEWFRTMAITPAAWGAIVRPCMGCGAAPPFWASIPRRAGAGAMSTPVRRGGRAKQPHSIPHRLGLLKAMRTAGRCARPHPQNLPATLSGTQFKEKNRAISYR